MSVESQPNSDVYLADGVLREFQCSAKIYAEDEVQVELLDADGVSTVQILTAHYTVSILGGVGTVKFNIAPESGVKVYLTARVRAIQPENFKLLQDFPGEKVEAVLDRLTRAIHGLDARIQRTPDLGVGVDVSAFATQVGVVADDLAKGLSSSINNAAAIAVNLPIVPIHNYWQEVDGTDYLPAFNRAIADINAGNIGGIDFKRQEYRLTGKPDAITVDDVVIAGNGATLVMDVAAGANGTWFEVGAHTDISRRGLISNFRLVCENCEPVQLTAASFAAGLPGFTDLLSGVPSAPDWVFEADHLFNSPNVGDRADGVMLDLTGVTDAKNLSLEASFQPEADKTYRFRIAYKYTGTAVGEDLIRLGIRQRTNGTTSTILKTIDAPEDEVLRVAYVDWTPANGDELSEWQFYVNVPSRAAAIDGAIYIKEELQIHDLSTFAQSAAIVSKYAARWTVRDIQLSGVAALFDAGDVGVDGANDQNSSFWTFQNIQGDYRADFEVPFFYHRKGSNLTLDNIYVFGPRVCETSVWKIHATGTCDTLRFTDVAVFPKGGAPVIMDIDHLSYYDAVADRTTLGKVTNLWCNNLTLDQSYEAALKFNMDTTSTVWSRNHFFTNCYFDIISGRAVHLENKDVAGLLERVHFSDCMIAYKDKEAILIDQHDDSLNSVNSELRDIQFIGCSYNHGGGESGSASVPVDAVIRSNVGEVTVLGGFVSPRSQGSTFNTKRLVEFTRDVDGYYINGVRLRDSMLRPLKDPWFKDRDPARYCGPCAPFAEMRKPLVIGANGQSNMLSSPVSVGGTSPQENFVFAWDADNVGGDNADFSSGTQFQISKLGQNPYQTSVDPDLQDGYSLANNALHHFAVQARRETGRPVYVLMWAQGSTRAALWLDSGTDRGTVADRAALAALDATGFNTGDYVYVTSDGFSWLYDREDETGSSLEVEANDGQAAGHGRWGRWLWERQRIGMEAALATADLADLGALTADVWIDNQSEGNSLDPDDTIWLAHKVAYRAQLLAEGWADANTQYLYCLPSRRWTLGARYSGVASLRAGDPKIKVAGDAAMETTAEAIAGSRITPDGDALPSGNAGSVFDNEHWSGASLELLGRRLWEIYRAPSDPSGNLTEFMRIEERGTASLAIGAGDQVFLFNNPFPDSDTEFLSVQVNYPADLQSVADVSFTVQNIDSLNARDVEYLAIWQYKG